MERSNSAPVESQVEDETAKDLTLPRAQTVSGTSASTLTSPRRRTWFGGASQNDEASISRSDSEESPDLTQRGRPTEILRRVSSNGTTTPQPSTIETPHPPSDDTASVSNRRSTSQHSQASSSPSHDSTSPPTSEPSSSLGQQDSLFSGFRSKSPGQPLQKDPSASPTSNFFQTLKSRDKQAISNTAKEAIRKWGVSWGGLKKGNNQPANSEDGVSDSESLRDAEGNSSKHRSSYAEVRAAVEQRRTGTHADGLLRPDYTPSEPVAIPGSSEKRRSISPSLSTRSQHDTPPPSLSPLPDAHTTDHLSQPRSISPGPSTLSPPQLPPRTRTMSHHSQTGAETVIAPIVDEDEHPAHVIQAQPSAPKAMTIPGIHAKHRGEVMSMGYAPPPPPSEPRKPTAIPNMYRLWKSPSNQPSTTQSEPETQTGFSGTDQDLPSSNPTAASSSSTSMPGPALPPRPVPPPLPPRSVSINAVQNISEPPRHPPEINKTSPPATATLQSIASRDENKRNSQEFLKLSSSPSRASMFKGNGCPPVATEENENGQDTPALIDVDTTHTPVDVVTKPTPPALPPRRPQVAQ